MQIQDLTTSQWGDYCIDGDVSVTLNGSHSYRFIIYVRAGVTVSNKTIYPMLRLVTDPDDTYVPHAMTNKELTDKVTPKNTTITYESGISQNVPNSIAMVTVGNIVILNTDLVGVVAEKSAWVSLGTVQASIKPSVYKTMNALLNAKTDVCDCQITNEGVLRIRNNSNAIVSTDIVHVNGVYFFNIT